jgi:hypothetical protein
MHRRHQRTKAVYAGSIPTLASIHRRPKLSTDVRNFAFLLIRGADYRPSTISISLVERSMWINQ